MASLRHPFDAPLLHLHLQEVPPEDLYLILYPICFDLRAAHGLTGFLSEMRLCFHYSVNSIKSEVPLHLHTHKTIYNLMWNTVMLP